MTRAMSLNAPARPASFWISRHWLLIINGLMGMFVGLPWLAPALMRIGWTGGAQIIYLLYATQCHQLPQRSFFLFGQQATYSLAEIQAAWYATVNPFVLRQFIGNAQMGWKVAWSDRMVAVYTSMWLGGLLFGVMRQHGKPLSLWAFVLMILPMVIDGGTHFLSDFSGLGHGFRNTNAWLAVLTAHTLPATFYAGDQLGSFNSWMRLLTGALFGLGVTGLMLPYLRDALADARPADRTHGETQNEPA